MRLPRLPVSRRRHERVCAEANHAHREADKLGKAMSAARRERDLASQAADVLQSRVARLERAIRGHVTATSGHDHEHLRVVLDGHDRQEADERKPCYVCGSHWGTAQRIYVGGDRWLHADCQDRVERTSVNYRPERGYASSAQSPTGNPPSDPGPGGRR